MELQGYYINLAASTGRDAAMRRRLDALGLAGRYRRFDAVRGSDSPLRTQSRLAPGHLGCWLSHEALWKLPLPEGAHLHVLEDDAVPGPLMAGLLQQASLPPADWDLLFTDAYFHPPPTPEQFALIRRAVGAFGSARRLSLLSLARLPFTGTTSYIVNRDSLPRLRQLLEGRWREARTLDVVLQDLVRQGRLRACITLPFLSTIGPENLASTTGDQGPALQSLNAFRMALFHGADPAAIWAAVRPAGALPDTEPLLALYLELLRDVLGTLQEG